MLPICQSRVRLIALTTLLIFSPAAFAGDVDASVTGVGLNVADLDRAEKFYAEVFDMERVFRYPSEGKLLEVGLARPAQPGLTVILAKFNDDPLPDEKSAYGRLIVTTPDAAAIAARAEQRGSTIRNLSSGEAGAPVIIFFDDPDGYQIELYQPP